jgi:RNA polymerase sigma-70 factor (ECF subfamily)
MEAMDTSATELALRLLEQREWLRELARQLVGAGEADDLAQETWLHALRRPVQGVLDTRAWLAAIARNLARGKNRGRRHARSREESVARSEALPSTAELIERIDTEQALARALVELREPYRTTLLLRFHEGLSAEEIARREGIAAGTVRWRTKQGLAELRQRLERDFGGRTALGVALVALLPEGARPPAGTTGIGAGGLLMGVGMKTVAATIAVRVVLVLGLAYAPWRGSEGGAQRRVAAVDRAPLVPTRETTSVGAPSLASELSRRAPATIDAGIASGAGSARIHVLESDGSAHAKKLVLLLSNADEPATSASTDESGWLELAPSPEPRAAVVERANALPYRTSIERSAGERELRLPEGAVIEGRFVVSGAAPRRALGFELFAAASAAELTYADGDAPEAALEVALARLEANVDGHFRVHGLDPERGYNLLVGPGYARPEWLTATAEQPGGFGRPVVHVARPERGLVIELVRLASLSGRLVDAAGRPTSGMLQGRVARTNGTDTDFYESVGADGGFELFLSHAWRGLELDYWGTPVCAASRPPASKRRSSSLRAGSATCGSRRVEHCGST